MKRLTVFILLFSAFSFGLNPSQVAVLVNADEPASVSLGLFYCRARLVPEKNIIPLRLGREKLVSISFDEYFEFVAKPVRKALDRDELQDIRCLVTTYLMPYKIAAPNPTPEQLKTIEEIKLIGDEYQCKMLKIAKKLNPNFAEKTYDNYNEAVLAVEKQIAGIIDDIKAASKDEVKGMRVEKFFDAAMPLYGAFIASQMSMIEFNLPLDLSQEVLFNAARSRKFVEKVLKEDWSYSRRLREDYYQRYAEVYGILDMLKSLDSLINALSGNSKASALDSELALVRQQNYDLHSWLDNPLRDNINHNDTLIVSRIDGSSERLCREIIDNSIKAENAGLTGKVCIDADSSKVSGKYRVYNNSLIKTASLFNSAGWDVVKDDTAELMQDVKDIETAFYCGWYSPGKYVDAFNFACGAIGYHISSYDASDLRDLKSSQWVVSMLDNGVVATIGAVDEPYLTAFPLPEEFFGKILEGKTVGEAFAMTNPFNSWQVILIADPLYKPVKLK